VVVAGSAWGPPKLRSSFSPLLWCLFVDMGKEVSQAKVFGTVGLVLAVCAITFFGPKQKKSGHNLFDTQR
jgi:hypothetical protein